MKRPQAGFTLLEVVVAMTVVGAGFAAGLAAMSGSLRLIRSAGEYEQAMLLARATMTEALTYPDYDITDDREREVYMGVEYAYRVEFRPVRLIPSDQSAGSGKTLPPPSPAASLPPTSSPTSSPAPTPAPTPAPASAPAPAPLEQISVDVYWGEGRGRTYRLVTYQPRQSASAGSQTRVRGNAPATGGAATKDGAASGAAGSGEHPLETLSPDDQSAR
jgi:prepilin-type N-terminal cleavage/methylation domain-containing protein